MQKAHVELQKDDIASIQNILGSDYTVCNICCSCGAHCISISIKRKDGEKFILKRPIVENNEWIEFQLARHKNISEIFSAAQQLSGVEFEVIESYGKQHYISKYLGEPLGQHIPDMDSEMQKKIANQLAQFLSSIHKNGSIQNKPFKSFEYPSFSAINNYFSDFLSQDEKSLIAEVARKIENYKSSPFPTVFIHGDFRSDNILYCKDTGKVSVIDFECSGFSNILREFALGAMSALGFSFGFWSMVIEEYGRVGNAVITPEIVRTLMAASIIHEHGRCAIAAQASGLELYERCRYMKIRLKSLFEEFR